MPAIEWDRAVSTSFEAKNFLLHHWVEAIFAAFALYLLKNKYANGLNGIPGPFLGGAGLLKREKLTCRFH